MGDLDGPNLGRSLRTLRCDPRAAHVLLLPNVYQIVTSHPDGGMCIYHMTGMGESNTDDSSGGRQSARKVSALPSGSAFAAMYPDLRGGNVLNKISRGSA